MREYPFRAIGGAAAIADGQNTSLLGLLLAAAASRNNLWVLVDAIYLMSGSLTAVTGVGIQVTLRRIKSLSDGTAGSIAWMDELDEGPQYASQLTCVTGGTVATAGTTFGFRGCNNDEVSLTGQADVVERPIWKPARPDNPLVIKPGTGIDIEQITSSTAGAWIPEIAGRLCKG
jgi:hypothetical protein